MELVFSVFGFGKSTTAFAGTDNYLQSLNPAFICTLAEMDGLQIHSLFNPLTLQNGVQDAGTKTKKQVVFCLPVVDELQPKGTACSQPYWTQ